MRTFALITLAIYITGFVVFAATSVGESYGPSTYGAQLPITMLLFLLVPAVLGYIAGDSSRE